MGSITELESELTNEIDVVGAQGAVRLLRQSDAQIFYGWRHFPSLLDNEVIESMKAVVHATHEILAAGRTDAVVVLAGAGTSGRIAAATARTFNAILASLGRTQCFRYLIAGGDAALLRPKENVEDNVVVAVEDLRRITSGASKVLYVGITCGFSAPYVAAQVQFALDLPAVFSACLVGFNPLERARNVPIEGWDRTFKQVALALEQLAKREPLRYSVINPVVGPEPITGSTRMKGGSATKIILDSIFATAVAQLEPSARPLLVGGCTVESPLRGVLNSFGDAVVQLYKDGLDSIAAVAQAAGHSLSSHARLIYIAGGRAAIAAVTDASECMPTFGAKPTDVTAYLQNGWGDLSANSLSAAEAVPQIGIPYFESEVAPTLGVNDTVVFMTAQPLDGDVSWMIPVAQRVKKQGAQLACVLLRGGTAQGANVEQLQSLATLNVNVAFEKLMLITGCPSLADLALKLVANAISTVGYVLAGKVFRNRMIDLRISNSKLLDRAVGIVSSVMRVDKSVAENAVMSAVHLVSLDDCVRLSEVKALPASAHVSATVGRDRVVPLAMLLATGKFTTQEAAEALEKQPVVRTLITTSM
eukprot:TRINITY_DN11283_c0_g1_i1.p1 TRINITY_DN11283_c0_g1~~TRINITY_DN11283_c0_g1_i1.p1  ORF type:complete len:598 (-),score=135.62 TRINITY_DN11283_c0_g1_i1:681-2447(-)